LKDKAYKFTDEGTVGSTLGKLEGTTVGSGVGFPSLYVGPKVGKTEGADEGEKLGSGVG